MADGFGTWGAARLARDQHVMAELAQPFGQPADLGGFPGPFPAFEAYE